MGSMTYHKEFAFIHPPSSQPEYYPLLTASSVLPHAVLINFKVTNIIIFFLERTYTNSNCEAFQNQLRIFISLLICIFQEYSNIQVCSAFIGVHYFRFGSFACLWEGSYLKYSVCYQIKKYHCAQHVKRSLTLYSCTVNLYV